MSIIDKELIVLNEMPSCSNSQKSITVDVSEQSYPQSSCSNLPASEKEPVSNDKKKLTFQDYIQKNKIRLKSPKKPSNSILRRKEDSSAINQDSEISHTGTLGEKEGTSLFNQFSDKSFSYVDWTLEPIDLVVKHEEKKDESDASKPPDIVFQVADTQLHESDGGKSIPDDVTDKPLCLQSSISYNNEEKREKKRVRFSDDFEGKKFSSPRKRHSDQSGVATVSSNERFSPRKRLRRRSQDLVQTVGAILPSNECQSEDLVHSSVATGQSNDGFSPRKRLRRSSQDLVQTVGAIAPSNECQSEDLVHSSVATGQSNDGQENGRRSLKFKFKRNSDSYTCTSLIEDRPETDVNVPEKKMEETMPSGNANMETNEIRPDMGRRSIDEKRGKTKKNEEGRKKSAQETNLNGAEKIMEEKMPSGTTSTETKEIGPDTRRRSVDEKRGKTKKNEGERKNFTQETNLNVPEKKMEETMPSETTSEETKEIGPDTRRRSVDEKMGKTKKNEEGRKKSAQETIVNGAEKMEEKMPSGTTSIETKEIGPDTRRRSVDEKRGKTKKNEEGRKKSAQETIVNGAEKIMEEKMLSGTTSTETKEIRPDTRRRSVDEKSGKIKKNEEVRKKSAQETNLNGAEKMQEKMPSGTTSMEAKEIGPDTRRRSVDEKRGKTKKNEEGRKKSAQETNWNGAEKTEEKMPSGTTSTETKEIGHDTRRRSVDEKRGKTKKNEGGRKNSTQETLLDKESEVEINSALKKEGYVTRKFLFCSICNIVSVSEDIAQKHIKSEYHTVMAKVRRD